MPTYEYACTACGTHVDVVQRISEEPLTKCGACGGPLRRVFHPVGILFKGSGFYSTDNRSRSKSSTSESSPEPAKEADGGSGSSADRASSQPKGSEKKSEGKPGKKEEESA